MIDHLPSPAVDASFETTRPTSPAVDPTAAGAFLKAVERHERLTISAARAESPYITTTKRKLTDALHSRMHMELRGGGNA
jgi:hypothetical protein